MKALVVYCHPNPASFTAAVRDVILARLNAAGADVRLSDLYADGFQPVMTGDELMAYPDAPANRVPVDEHCRSIEWCDTLIFIYPTWWYGLPAMLKGWLERVLLPGVAFLMPDESHVNIRPNLHHIKRLGVFTTCGASRWLMFIAGSPGRRTLMRGIGFLLHPRSRKVFAAHYAMDSATKDSRARHLAYVGNQMDRLIETQSGRRKTA